MFQAFANTFRIPELRSRLLLTVALLAVYRIGWNIPLPGIDPDKLKALMEGSSGGNPLTDFLNIISGGGLQRASLFSLGIMPYISASIIFSLLVSSTPARFVSHA